MQIVKVILLFLLGTVGWMIPIWLIWLIVKAAQRIILKRRNPEGKDLPAWQWIWDYESTGLPEPPIGAGAWIIVGLGLAAWLGSIIYHNWLR